MWRARPERARSGKSGSEIAASREVECQIRTFSSKTGSKNMGSGSELTFPAPASPLCDRLAAIEAGVGTVYAGTALSGSTMMVLPERAALIACAVTGFSGA